MNLQLPAPEIKATDPSKLNSPDLVKETFGKDYDPNLGGIENNTSTRGREREINIEEIKNANIADNVKVNLFDTDEAASSFVAQPTNPSNIPVDGQTNPNAGATDPTSRPFINAQGSSGAGISNAPPMNKEQFSGSAEVIVVIIDIVLSMALKALAQDPAGTDYSANAQQRELLKKALVNFLHEKQINMSPAMVLGFAIISVYGVPAKKAVESRMNIMKAKKRVASGTTTMQNTNGQVPLQKQPIVTPFNDVPKHQAPQFSTPLKDDALPANDRGEVYFPDSSYSWQNPDPNITVKTREELFKYVNQGIFPMYIINKTNKIKKPILYKNGVPKLEGRPSKFGT